jgi:hypothetical protein
MSYRVRIFLRRSDQNAGRYVGERYLQEISRLHGPVLFDSGAGMQQGKVEGIFPDTWEPTSELIPSIHVVQDAQA